MLPKECNRNIILLNLIILNHYFFFFYDFRKMNIQLDKKVHITHTLIEIIYNSAL